MGYNSYWKVLNAKDYGIPQNRERVFIISIRKDIDDGKFKFPEPFDNGLRLKDMLEDKVEDKYYINNAKTDELLHKLKEKETSNSLVLDSNELQLFTNLEGGKWDKMQDVNKRVYDEKGISPTISTCQGGHREPKVCANYRIRKLTPLECWRLMGFKDEDYWKARKALEVEHYNGRDRSNSQMYKMAGNSIVVDVLEHIFKNLFNT